MNFVWLKECSMQSEFPLTLVDCFTHAAWCLCHVSWTRHQWSMIPFTDESPASLLLSMMAGDTSVLGSENASLDTLFGRLIAMEANQ